MATASTDNGKATDVRQKTVPLTPEQWWQAVVHESRDAIVTMTVSGDILTWNPAAERIYGFGADEVLGRKAGFLVPPDAADELPAVIEKIVQNEPVENYETTRTRKDGAIVDVSMSVSALHDANGRVVGISTIARDVTARKQKELTAKHSAEREQSERGERERVRLAELEKFQRLTVGRELKMIELKKEIAELRRRLGEMP